MGNPAKPIPEGYHSITPHLIVRSADNAIEFYKRAFGAEERGRHSSPDGKIMHSEIKIGDSILMLVDEYPEWKCLGPESRGGTSVTLHLYVEDADAVFNRAVAAGAKVLMPVQDAFWGDRYGKLADPFGHEWSIGTRKEELTHEEVAKRADAFFAQMGQKQQRAGA